MKLIATITATLTALLIAGCSKTESSPSSSNAGSAYPKDAASVTSNPGFKFAFKSDQTGISYYLRRLTADEISKMPDDNVIKGENASLLYVPIKDDKIIDAPLSDRVALVYKIPPEMLK